MEVTDFRSEATARMYHLLRGLHEYLTRYRHNIEIYMSLHTDIGAGKMNFQL